MRRGQRGEKEKQLKRLRRSIASAMREESAAVTVAAVTVIESYLYIL